MNIVYLDQFLPIRIRTAKERGDGLALELANVMSWLVDEKIAIFPYSENHIAETTKASDDITRRWTGEFWDRMSRGYRFIEGKHIRAQQALDMLEKRPHRFVPQRGVFECSQLTFIQYLEKFDLQRDLDRAEGFKKVVKWWGSQDSTAMTGKIAQMESDAIIKLNLDLLGQMFRQEKGYAAEFDKEYSVIASEISWHFQHRGYGSKSLLYALHFLQDNAIKIPSLQLDAYATEALAVEYGKDLRNRRDTEKSELDHFCHDFEAFSNCMPYCDIGIFDAPAVVLFKKVLKRAAFPPMTLFRADVVGEFKDALLKLPRPERNISPADELKMISGRALLLMPREEDALLRRENLPSTGNVTRQLLPGGGLKVASTCDNWPKLLEILQHTVGQFERECSGDSVLYSGNENGEISFKIEVPFGNFELCDGLQGKLTTLSAH